MSEEWNEEDEFVDADNAEEATEEVSKTLPEGVMQRITAQAERTNKTVEEVTTRYIEYIKTNHECDDPYSEDEDLLIDWSESAFIVDRSTGSGGGGGETFLGSIIGVGDKKVDRLENLRSMYIKQYTDDPTQMIESGRLGVYTDTSADGKLANWRLHTDQEAQDTDTPTSEAPPFAFRADGKWVTFVSKNGRKAYSSTRMGRYLWFLGNNEKDFMDGKLELWRLDVTDDNADAVYQIGHPCRIKVRLPRENAPDYLKDVLQTNRNFAESIEYTDAFLDDEERHLVHPNMMWMDTSEAFVDSNGKGHGMYVPLAELAEAYDTRSRTFEGRDGQQGRAGPLVFTKGTVSRMSTEPMQSDYDQEGYTFSMSLTNTTLSDEITCWISNAAERGGEPFMAGWGEEAIPYAERSTVLVFGRIGMRVKDGKSTPRMNVYGVYADPRRARRRIGGGDTSVDQFKEGGE